MRSEKKNLDTYMSELIKSAGVPGLSMFIAEGGSEDIRAFGVRNIETGGPVDSATVFKASSLSKPVVAHAALQLVDDGKRDLDESLSRFAGPLLPLDPASATITTGAETITPTLLAADHPGRGMTGWP